MLNNLNYLNSSNLIKIIITNDFFKSNSIQTSTKKLSLNNNEFLKISWNSQQSTEKNNNLKGIVKIKWKIANKVQLCLLDINLPLDNSDILSIECQKAKFIYKLH